MFGFVLTATLVYKLILMPKRLIRALAYNKLFAEVVIHIQGC